jgi:hypothetical protein
MSEIGEVVARKCRGGQGHGSTMGVADKEPDGPSIRAQFETKECLPRLGSFAAVQDEIGFKNVGTVFGASVPAFLSVMRRRGGCTEMAAVTWRETPATAATAAAAAVIMVGLNQLRVN